VTHEIESKVKSFQVGGTDYICKPFQKEEIIARVNVQLKLRESQKSLKNLNLNLESIVAERTAELIVARDAAERANKAKSEFLSRMSHELRTPMNAILGFGQLLELDFADFNARQKDNIQEIMIAGQHLLSLINELLDLSLVESGKLEMTIENIAIDKLLSQCLSMIKVQAVSSGVELIDNVSAKNYVVQADFMRLKQVLLNLLSNALKYNCAQGTITIDAEMINNTQLRPNYRKC